MSIVKATLQTLSYISSINLKQYFVPLEGKKMRQLKTKSHFSHIQGRESMFFQWFITQHFNELKSEPRSCIILSSTVQEIGLKRYKGIVSSFPLNFNPKPDYYSVFTFSMIIFSPQIMQSMKLVFQFSSAHFSQKKSFQNLLQC